MDIKILNLGDECTGCMACYSVCPTRAISMKENPEGFLYPEIDINKCTGCYICEDRCPEIRNTFYVKEEKLLHKAYYGWHNDDEIRKQSSSGGIFSALAESILEGGGIVFGAIYDLKSNQVLHRGSNSIEWTKMRKSKYVQSYIGDTYKEVLELLDLQKQVLFVGTPCQVAGLMSFLNKSYSNLITCDFICHGVPSMKILREHLNIIGDKYHSKVVSFDFRPKHKGWTKHYFMFTLANGRTCNIPFFFDSYFSSYSKGIILRTSCYHCNYRQNQHFAEITLADFWGYKRHSPDIFDERGLSLVMANTKKGFDFLNNLDKESLTLNSLKWENASYHYTKGTCSNKFERDRLYMDYVSHGYKYIIRKYKLNGTFKSRFGYYVYVPIVTSLRKYFTRIKRYFE
ncbi:MAG: Coenzyme F420 hydrogenase/dehydrogenase, beta subunit C-terminal domain [Bacteroidales bacterium]|jgi:coenzyme F420-reducing hydrogenase beta subunit